MKFFSTIYSLQIKEELANEFHPGIFNVDEEVLKIVLATRWFIGKVGKKN